MSYAVTEKRIIWKNDGERNVKMKEYEWCLIDSEFALLWNQPTKEDISSIRVLLRMLEKKVKKVKRS